LRVAMPRKDRRRHELIQRDSRARGAEATAPDAGKRLLAGQLLVVAGVVCTVVRDWLIVLQILARAQTRQQGARGDDVEPMLAIGTSYDNRRRAVQASIALDRLLSEGASE
jgi:hypothetical protein